MTDTLEHFEFSAKAFPEYIGVYVRPEMKAWVESRARREGDEFTESDVLRWLLKRAMRQRPAGDPAPRGRSRTGEAMSDLLTVNLDTPTRAWIEKIAAGYGTRTHPKTGRVSANIPLGSVVRWVVEQEMEAEKTTPPARRRPRREVVG